MAHSSKIKIALLTIYLGIFSAGFGYYLASRPLFVSPALADLNATSSLESSSVELNFATPVSSEVFSEFYSGVRAGVGAQNFEPKQFNEKIISGVIPHHLLAGKNLALYFERLTNQTPPVVVLIGPNHPSLGTSPALSSLNSWQTLSGIISPDEKIINSLLTKNLIKIDNKIVGNETSVVTPLSFIKKTWPNTKVVPIILKLNTSADLLNNLASALKQELPSGSLVLASVDFSHYLPSYLSDWHDELALSTLASGNLANISRLEIDSPASIYFLLSYNKLVGAQYFEPVFHSNTASISGKNNILEGTSHIGGVFSVGSPVVDAPVTAQFFGDMMLERSVIKSAGKNKLLDYVFQNLRGEENRFFSGVNLFIANLEGPFAPTRIKTSKSIAFRFDPSLAPELKNYNFSAFNLANNHAYDMGVKNVAYTRQILAKNNLGYFGDELQEGPEYTWFWPPLLGKGEGGPPETLRVAMRAGGEVSSSIAFIGLHNTYHEPDLIKVEAALNDAKQKAKYVVVNIHWGEEYKQISNQKQRNLAHWLVDHGATAVIGGHPHVVEELEIYKNAPIFYSLGNFVFDQYFSAPTQEGLSVGLEFASGRVTAAYLFPIFSVKSQVELMNGDRRAKFLDWFTKNSRLDGKQIIDGKIEL